MEFESQYNLQENCIEIIVWQMAAIPSRAQCVNSVPGCRWSCYHCTSTIPIRRCMPHGNLDIPLIIYALWWIDPQRWLRHTVYNTGIYPLRDCRYNIRAPFTNYPWLRGPLYLYIKEVVELLSFCALTQSTCPPVRFLVVHPNNVNKTSKQRNDDILTS